VYRKEDRAEWDEFVRTAKNGHFMFLRDYMNYHVARFPDASLMFHDERGRLVGLLPATLQDGVLSSHAGLSFGGVISGRGMKAGLMLDLFSAMCARLLGPGIREFVYKPVPHIYHELPAEEDLYALFRCGARLIRRDVSATIGRHQRLPFSKGRAHAQNQAEKSGLVVEPSTDFEAFMTVQEEILRTRHNARPTHSAAELALLAGRFPDNIRLFVVRRGIEMLGGVVIYETARVAHTQYIGASEAGRRLGALDLIFRYLIHERYAEKDYFDFGISGEDGGRHLNAGLMRNKESYGARATIFDWYAFDPAAALDQLRGVPDDGP
jgi:GNAT acetyltransferase-like protein